MYQKETDSKLQSKGECYGVFCCCTVRTFLCTHSCPSFCLSYCPLSSAFSFIFLFCVPISIRNIFVCHYSSCNLIPYNISNRLDTNLYSLPFYFILVPCVLVTDIVSGYWRNKTNTRRYFRLFHLVFLCNRMALRVTNAPAAATF